MKITNFRLRGPSIVEESDIDTLRADLLDVIRTNPGIRLAVDFSDVGAISSRALGLLVAIRKEVKLNEGFMVIYGIQASVEKVMTVTRMNKLFPILPDMSAAEEALRTGPKMTFWQTESS